MIKKLRAGTALLKISREEKNKIFEDTFETESGDVITLLKELAASEESDQYYSQSVYLANVLQVAQDVEIVKNGDIVFVDYIADAEDKKIAYYDGDEKVIILDVNTKYHTDDKIAFASMNSRMDTYTWRKGDVESQSWIYAIYREGKLIPNNDYILLEHQNLTWEGTSKYGLSYYISERDMVIRKVIGVSETCKIGIKAGDLIAVDEFVLLERSINGVNFDIIMDIDILGTVSI